MVVRIVKRWDGLSKTEEQQLMRADYHSSTHATGCVLVVACMSASSSLLQVSHAHALIVVVDQLAWVKRNSVSLV